VNKKTFIKTRQPAWEEFSAFLDQYMNLRSQQMSSQEVQRYSQQFREISNDLSLVRSNNWGEDLEKYLNALVSRGHNFFYQSPATDWGKLITFLLYTFPQTFRKHASYFIVAASLFFGPLLCSWALVQWQPELASQVLPTEQLEQYEAMYGPDSSLNDEETEDYSSGRAFMFGFYINNNVGIALRTFASGILFGAVTAYLLLFNGIVIGTTAGYLVGQGYGDKFLSFIVSHGSFELTAIAVSGGAGFMLGHALLHPGQRTRLEALKHQGKDALIIGAGAAAMLVVAALIEAFWSPAPIPAALKYTVGAALWLWVMIYLMFSGRSKTPQTGDLI